MCSAPDQGEPWILRDEKRPPWRRNNAVALLELRECQQPFFSFLLPQNAALSQRVATAIFCLVSAESARAAIAGCVCHFEAVVTCVDAVKVDSFKLFMAAHGLSRNSQRHVVDTRSDPRVACVHHLSTNRVVARSLPSPRPFH